MKDLFSEYSALYKQARPSYPHSVIAEILKHVPARNFAWDCGAGSGQFTQLLAPYFEHIVATDLSEQQLHQAPYFENVSYQIQSAERTTFAEHSFDLITVAQAIHWFDFASFYSEVQRTLKKDGVIAVIGYGTLTVHDQTLNQHIQHLYHHVLKNDWDIERKHIDAHYKSIPFPFEPLADIESSMQFEWSKEQLLGYLNTWSALKHHRAKQVKQAHVIDPLVDIQQYLESFKDSIRVNFPLFIKIGKQKHLTTKTSMHCAKTQMMGLFKMRRLVFG